MLVVFNLGIKNPMAEFVILTRFYIWKIFKKVSQSNIIVWSGIQFIKKLLTLVQFHISCPHKQHCA